jgi:hypothetical protein
MLSDYFSDLGIWHFDISGFPFKLVLDVRYYQWYVCSESIAILIVTNRFLEDWPAIFVG